MKFLVACLSVVLLLGACGKSEDSASESKGDGSGSKGDTSPSTSNEPKRPYEDQSKPYITEERMGNLLNSLKERQNPFEILSEGGAIGAVTGSSLESMNAFARKHKFADAEEYMGAWGRVFAAYLAVKMEDVNKAAISGSESQLKMIEAELKKPDLDPEIRKGWEEQAKSLREQLEEARKPQDTEMNKQDLEVMRKHSKEYEEALNQQKKK
jgi:hypothetical protein